MNEVVNGDEFFNLKLPSIEKIEITEKEFEVIANKILNTEFSKKSQLEEMKEDFLNFVVFGKTSYYHVPSKQENNEKDI